MLHGKMFKFSEKSNILVKIFFSHNIHQAGIYNAIHSFLNIFDFPWVFMSSGCHPLMKFSVIFESSEISGLGIFSEVHRRMKFFTRIFSCTDFVHRFSFRTSQISRIYQDLDLYWKFSRDDRLWRNYLFLCTKAIFLWSLQFGSDCGYRLNINAWNKQKKDIFCFQCNFNSRDNLNRVTRKKMGEAYYPRAWESPKKIN